MNDDHRWMARALELARRGEAQTSPNPMVGAALVREGRVVGEGFHTYAEKKHAEVIALEEAGEQARGATLYVSLEPCCHTARTGPCTQAILEAGVSRVVGAMRDPNPAVAGRGFARLRRAGVHVVEGAFEKEARRMNEAFARWIRSGQPLVTLKAALTLDGKIAPPARESNERTRWITSPESRAEVQRMRHACDAVLTGIGTVLADDPLLTDRTGLPRRRRLLRVVLDAKLRLPLNSRLVKSAEQDLLVFTSQALDARRARALRAAGVELVRIHSGKRRPDLRAVMEELGRCEIQSLMIEAGAQVNAGALEAGVVDKVVLFYSPRLLGADSLPFAEGHYRGLKDLPALKDLTLRQLTPDFVVEGYLRDVYRNH